jgi:chemotaxis protein CheZ
MSAKWRKTSRTGRPACIQDRTTGLFEACNFQDLTGQRIGNIAETLKLVQAHVEALMQIWSGIPIEPPNRELDPHDALLNGPQLDGEAGHYSQNEIDGLFGAKPAVKAA